MSELSYALITPARSERANLERLAAALVGQTILPRHWIIVDNGSDDGTDVLAAELAVTYEWISTISIPARRDQSLGRRSFEPSMPGSRSCTSFPISL